MAQVTLPPYPDRFHKAAQYAGVPGTVEVDPKLPHPAKPFSDLTSLLLYSLYQQASHGPCTTQKPWFLNVVESAKWASWKELKNMAPVEAMRLFVRTLEEEEPDWWVKSLAKGVEASRIPAANGKAVQEFDDNAPFAPELHFFPSNKWELIECKGRKPAPRYQHAAVLVKQRMYVFGGNCNGRFLNDIHVLDLTNLTWSKLETPSPPVFPPCAGHRAVQKDSNTLLVVGGHSHDGVQHLTVRSFDMYTQEWSLIRTQGNPPVARGGHSVSQQGKSLWVFGGEDFRRKLLNDVHVLDTVTWTWTSVATSGPAPSPRSDHTACLRARHHLTVFGGGSLSICFQDLHELDLQTAVWSRRDVTGTVPQARAGHAAVVCEDKWYIAGGGDNKGGSLETVSLDLDSFKWSVIATVAGRTAISSEGLSVVAHGIDEERVLLSFGGYSGRYHNEVYAFRPAPLSGGPAAAKETQTQTGAAGSGAEVGAAVAGGASSAHEPEKDKDDLVARQLEEAAELAAKAEKMAQHAMTDAEIRATQARADAWQAISKAKMDEEELKEKVASVMKAKENADKQTEEAKALIVAARQSFQTAQAENGRLLKDLQDSRKTLAEAQLRASRVEENPEMDKLQRDYAGAKSALADTEQELLSVRGSLAGEQARCFRLEVEVAELRQRLQAMEALEKELELLRRQKAASEEAVVAATQKSAPGFLGWLSGPTPPAAPKS